MNYMWWLVVPIRRTNSCCRCLLRRICVHSTLREQTCDLYSNYAERGLVTVSGRECIIWCENKSKQVKYTQNLGHDDMRLSSRTTFEGP